MFLNGNRNKRSVVLDLKTPEGKARGAGARASRRRSGLQRPARRPAPAGTGLRACRAANPKIIYCAAVGYGSDGPDSGKAVYDDLMQAASGIAGLFGAVDGAPRYAPVNVCDRVVGLYVANAITAALLPSRHLRRGPGDRGADVRDHGAVRARRSHRRRAFVPPEGEMGYRRLLSRTRGPYPTKDGYLAHRRLHRSALAGFLRTDWRCRDLMDTDDRFRSQESRTRHAAGDRRVSGRASARPHQRGMAGGAARASISRPARSTRSRRCSTIRI